MENVQFLLEKTENIGGSQQIALRNTNSTVSMKRGVCNKKRVKGML